MVLSQVERTRLMHLRTPICQQQNGSSDATSNYTEVGYPTGFRELVKPQGLELTHCGTARRRHLVVGLADDSAPRTALMEEISGYTAGAARIAVGTVDRNVSETTLIVRI